MVAVYCVFAARLAVGANVAELPTPDTVPVTGALFDACLSEKVEAWKSVLSITSEKVADSEEFKATPSSAFSGAVAETIGRIVSGCPGGNPTPNCGGALSSPPDPPPQPNSPALAT